MCPQDQHGPRWTKMDQMDQMGHAGPASGKGKRDYGVKGDEMEEARTGPHPCSVEYRR